MSQQNLDGKTKEELAEIVLSKGAQLHLKNKTEGTLLPYIMGVVRGSNTQIADNLAAKILALDPLIGKRDDLIQKILLGRVLIVELMRLSVEKNMNVNNLLVLCDTALVNDVWKEGVLNHVIPALAANKSL